MTAKALENRRRSLEFPSLHFAKALPAIEMSRSPRWLFEEMNYHWSSSEVVHGRHFHDNHLRVVRCWWHHRVLAVVRYKVLQMPAISFLNMMYLVLDIDFSDEPLSRMLYLS